MVASRRRQLCKLLAAACITSGFSLAHAANPVVLVLGDSLSAEYGLRAGSGWVALLQKKLADQHLPTQVINASISGETTSGGRSRLPLLLKQHQPTVVVVELGANDALRGLPLAATADNLNAIVQASQISGAKVLLVGIQIPPNYGADYTQKFAAIYVQVAKTHKASLVPFMLKGIADRPDAANWFQADRIHPLEAAHPTILANIWPALQPLLGKEANQRP